MVEEAQKGSGSNAGPLWFLFFLGIILASACWFLVALGWKAEAYETGYRRGEKEGRREGRQDERAEWEYAGKYPPYLHHPSQNSFFWYSVRRLDGTEVQLTPPQNTGGKKGGE